MDGRRRFVGAIIASIVVRIVAGLVVIGGIGTTVHLLHDQNLA